MKHLEIFYASSTCDVYFNDQLKAVQTRWKGFYSEGDELRMILDKIIELLSIKKSRIVLADAREMKVISPVDQWWIVNDWYPRALKAGLKTEVLIVSRYSHNEASIKSIVRNYDEELVTTVYFYSYQEAAEWVMNNSDSLVPGTGHM